ncbi:MAG: polysaccharide biosynthesis/export family protein [Candidatus Omnitrophica bacterium]|nr:polysaccharide biosynthesis/export family protein [Candidatus Omnitrophota bacterium]
MRTAMRSAFWWLGIIFAGTIFLTPLYSQNATLKEEIKQHYERGNALYEQGRFKEAQEEFDKALQLVGESRAHASSGAVDKAGPGKKATIEATQKQAVKIGSVKKSTPAQETAPLDRKTQKRPEYLIGPHDILQVSVWQNKDLDQEVIVRPDGKISFPLVGDMDAEGFTITELDAMLTEKLKEYVRYPEVSISLKKMGGQKVIVLGEVSSPGVYGVSGSRTVLEAIGLAGGFTKDAVPSGAVLIRGGFSSPEATRINLSRALKGDLSQNFMLTSNDIIFVPKKFIANLNYFLNQILDPISRGVYISKEINTF